MAVIRIAKTKDYTVMSNHHLRDKNLSLKAKGLMSLMLSLPDNWDYTIAGLIKMCKENETAINSALKELKENGYLIVRKFYPNETGTGRIEYEYNIFETSQGIEPRETEPLGLEKQVVKNQGVENQGVENQGQINTNIINTKGKNTNQLSTNIYIDHQKTKKEPKHKYGQYERVLLTEKQLSKLKEDFGEEFILQAIDRLDEYVQSNNNKNRYTDFNLVLRKAIREKWSLLTDLKGCTIIEDKPKKKSESILDHLKSKYNLGS